MRNLIFIIFIIIMSFFGLKAFSQTFEKSTYRTVDIKDELVYKPYYLEISYNMTTNIIFPNIIKSVDRGSKDVLAQRAEGVENVLRIKADKENFENTNLTVITADGKIYSFLLHYNENPHQLTINLNLEGLTFVGSRYNLSNSITQISKNSYVIFEDVKVPETELRLSCFNISKKSRFIKKIGERQNGILFANYGIYIRDNVIYFQLLIKNKTRINYDIDFIKFYIRDKVLVKKTAIQDVEAPVLFEDNPNKVVLGKTKVVKVFALPKFTIPDDKNLVIELYEKNGGRHSRLTIPNSVIIQARFVENI